MNSLVASIKCFRECCNKTLVHFKTEIYKMRIYLIFMFKLLKDWKKICSYRFLFRRVAASLNNSHKRWKFCQKHIYFSILINFVWSITFYQKKIYFWVTKLRNTSFHKVVYFQFVFDILNKYHLIYSAFGFHTGGNQHLAYGIQDIKLSRALLHKQGSW